MPGLSATPTLDLRGLGGHGQTSADRRSRLRKQARSPHLGGLHSKRLRLEIYRAELLRSRQPSERRALPHIRAIATPECKFARTSYQAQLPQTWFLENLARSHRIAGQLSCEPRQQSWTGKLRICCRRSPAGSACRSAVPAQVVAAPADPPPSLAGSIPHHLRTFAADGAARRLRANCSGRRRRSGSANGEQTPPPDANYRMIRRQNGFIFDHSR